MLYSQGASATTLQMGAIYIYAGDVLQWQGALMVCTSFNNKLGLGTFKATRIPLALHGRCYVGETLTFHPYKLRLYKPANNFGLWIRKMEGKKPCAR